MATYSDWRPYNAEDVRANPPTSAGVYMIRCHRKEGNPVVRYVGQAKNLRDRLADHLSGSEPNKKLVEHRKHEQDYTWVELARQADRDSEESAKIEKYKPECNTQGK